ncbi:methyltransferase [Sulfitobacter sp. D35]|uniref:methyltransferase n=1 Tax=Sulfitobacter sp. D35 TaxID=3083252 RepID=UPI00296EB3C1|nr:methyltransferase [Sulfitobacter sp. D35]MDW4499421.1 methyltransferase [Sulfitobacter sp. D35]
MPFARRIARREGAEIFDLLQGFVAAQVLTALVELDLLDRLLEGPMTGEQAARLSSVPTERMSRLLNAGVALGLLKRTKARRYALTMRGAVVPGVPGLQEMIRHNLVLYRDLADPVALLRGDADTEMRRFWPYVFGQSGDVPDAVAERYSSLMADSQALVAEDTVRAVGTLNARVWLDVGGGAGAFLSRVLREDARIEAILFDLPGVMPSAETFLTRAGLRSRVRLQPGNFREDPLPDGADVISLVRVLYDHSDDTVRDLLARVFAALPRGGRLVISEPMSGGERPDPACDVYFAFYTMAMGSGTLRAQTRIAAMCGEAGFADIRMPRPVRSYVTSVVQCTKPRR